jgi:hypothetical protein
LWVEIFYRKELLFLGFGVLGLAKNKNLKFWFGWEKFLGAKFKFVLE